MNPKTDHPLTTADLAKADEMRGRGADIAVGRAATDERPADPDRSAAEVRAQTDTPRVAAGGEERSGSDRPALFPERDASELRKRWSDVQTGFVDEPRRAVEQADGLVAEVMKRLAEGFAAERANLERQWDRGDNVTTEDLRLALQRYRSFFDRLLSF